METNTNTNTPRPYAFNPFTGTGAARKLECGCVLGVEDGYRDCRYGNTPNHPEVEEV